MGMAAAGQLSRGMSHSSSGAGGRCGLQPQVVCVQVLEYARTYAVARTLAGSAYRYLPTI